MTPLKTLGFPWLAREVLWLQVHTFVATQTHRIPERRRCCPKNDKPGNAWEVTVMSRRGRRVNNNRLTESMCGSVARVRGRERPTHGVVVTGILTDALTGRLRAFRATDAPVELRVFATGSLTKDVIRHIETIDWVLSTARSHNTRDQNAPQNSRRKRR